MVGRELDASRADGVVPRAVTAAEKAAFVGARKVRLALGSLSAAAWKRK